MARPRRDLRGRREGGAPIGDVTATRAREGEARDEIREWNLRRKNPEHHRFVRLEVQREEGGGSGTQLPVDRPGGGGSGTQWRPDCPKCSDGWDGWVDHALAAGIVIGAVAGAAAVIGSTWYSLPLDCPAYYWDEINYYSCDGNWYEPQYEGDTIVYVTIPDPSNGQLTPAK